jgi:VCBS repeat-containing protein
MNARQILALNEVINGHNLLILGQSGTWKIYLDNEIEDQLTKGAKVCDFFLVTGLMIPLR